MRSSTYGITSKLIMSLSCVFGFLKFQEINMNVFTIARRHYYMKRSTLKSWKNGVKHGKVTYYPRDHNEIEDPPIEPSKLLIVQRVKPVWGNPYWDKAILEQLKLTEKKSDIAIVKNTPEMCMMLWKIKHLVKVTPMKLPDKLPEEGGSFATYLHENGTLMVVPGIDKTRCEKTDEFINDVKKFDSETIRKLLRLKWLNPM